MAQRKKGRSGSTCANTRRSKRVRLGHRAGRGNTEAVPWVAQSTQLPAQIADRPNQHPSTVEAQPQVGDAPPPPLPDDLIFDLNQKRTRFSDQVLLDQVRAFGQIVGGRAFGTEEFM